MPSIGGRREQTYCCVEVAQEIEKNPVGISTNSSQLVVKTGRSGEGLGGGRGVQSRQSHTEFLADEAGSGSGQLAAAHQR